MYKKISFLFMIAIIFSFLLISCNSDKSEKNDNVKEADNKYPEHPIDVVVPFGEGSASDTFARKFSNILSDNSDVSFQPVNKDGSGGLSGMLYADQQKNDGYTVLEVTPSHVISDILGKGGDKKFSEEFEPLAHIQSDIYILSVPENSNIENYEDLIEKGKKDKITFGGVSPAGLDDFSINAFAKEADIDTQFIPYPSGSEVKAAALGGEVDVYVDKVVNVIDYIKSNKIRPIVIFHDERITQLDELKDIPTTKEKGIDLNIGSWRGFVIKKDAPDEVKEYLTNQMKDAFETDEYEEFAEDNLVNIGEEYLDPDEFEEKIESEYKKLDEVAQDLDIK